MCCSHGHRHSRVDTLRAQTNSPNADQKPLAFDVAAIKPNTTSAETSSIVEPGGRYTARSCGPGDFVALGAEIFSRGHHAARAMTLSNLTLNVSRWTDRVVVDRTALTGKFDWEIQWVPDDLSVSDVKPLDGPSLFSALRDQAGLKLQSARTKIDVLVIDHAERPTPD